MWLNKLIITALDMQKAVNFNVLLPPILLLLLAAAVVSEGDGKWNEWSELKVEEIIHFAIIEVTQ